jgi:dTDP-4-amino-4,6-dideoxygalactose transaminase
MSPREPLIPFVDLAAMHAPLRARLSAALEESMDRGDFILGDAVSEFEMQFARYCGSAFAVGVDSGTSALELALRALDIGPGDEVITAASTFIATALAIHHVGAVPVLVDVDPATANLDPELLSDAITPRTRAIIPVHLYGHPADMDPICAIARKHDLRVIEDASQAHGARYRGSRVGTFGDVAAFSLYPAKNLGAFGDAGILVTDDEGLAERLRLLRNYGSPIKYHHMLPGFNRRLDTLQARILSIKLEYLDGWNAQRRASAAYYHAALGSLAPAVQHPFENEDCQAVYHLYVIRSSNRDALQRHLGAAGIGTVIHYPIPIHLQPAFAHLGHGQGAFPVTEQLANTILSLPMYPGITEADQHRVVRSIADFSSVVGTAAH